MELNRVLCDESGQIYDILAGSFIVAGLSDDAFTSLPEELQRKYYKLFKHPEMFFWDGNQIRVVSIEM
jgi:hypothetical protein